MPQPLDRAPTGIEYRPNALLANRPHHAARMGLVAAEWAALEEHLINALAFSLFALVNPEAHNVATKTLYALESLSARLGVLDTLLKQRIAPELYTYFVKTLKPEIRRRAKERNKIVHGHWGIVKEFPDDVIRISPENRHERYTLKDLEDISERIINTSNKIATFMGWIAGTMPSPFTVTLPLMRR